MLQSPLRYVLNVFISLKIRVNLVYYCMIVCLLLLLLLFNFIFVKLVLLNYRLYTH